MKEPFYHLDYTSSECLFRIYLNEILILDNIDGQISLAGNLLLNNYIYKAGEQNLRIEILPQKNESLLNKDSFVEIYLYASDQSTGFKEKIEIIGKGTKLPEELLLSDNEIAKSPINWYINFNANVPYNLTPIWQQGINLNKNRDLENRIKAFYFQVYQLAKEGNAVKLYDILKSSFERTQTVMFEKSNSNTIAIFEKLIKRQPIGGHIYQLQNIEDTTLRIYAKDKIADIIRKDGNPILFFKKDKKDETGASLEIRVFIDNNGNFQVL